MTDTLSDTASLDFLRRLTDEIKRALKDGDIDYALKKARDADRDFPHNPRILSLKAEAFLAAGARVAGVCAPVDGERRIEDAGELLAHNGEEVAHDDVAAEAKLALDRMINIKAVDGVSKA